MQGERNNKNEEIKSMFDGMNSLVGMEYDVRPLKTQKRKVQFHGGAVDQDMRGWLR